MNEEVRNDFDELTFQAIAALGNLMTCKEICKNQRAVMKISRVRAWLADLKPVEDTGNAEAQKENV